MNDAPEKRIDHPTGTELVGHEWDGIEELNTPLPRWWLWTFYLTIAFSLVYVIAYPAWPLVSSATTGVLEWSSRGDLARDMEAANAERADLRAQLASTSVTELRAEPALFRQAVAGGAAAFKLHCSQCHGSNAAGNQSLGYPNLNDDDWLWGGDLAAIHYSIDRGIRQAEDNHARQSLMPAFGELLSREQIEALADHVLSLSGQGEGSTQGAELYATNCASCHGPSGAGDRLLGAPKLDDAIWLRGNSRSAIIAQISNPRMGAMPAWGDRLDPVTIKMLTAYVHSRGGGEETPAPELAAAESDDGEQP